MAERLAFTAESIEELKMKLMSFSNDHNIEHAHIWRSWRARSVNWCSFRADKIITAGFCGETAAVSIGFRLSDGTYS